MTPEQDISTQDGTARRPGAHGLYRPEFEHDSCGVGFVAHIKGERSHQIIRDADHLLCRMEHRGARGAEKNTGDGTGILTALPHEFLGKVARASFGKELPEPGRFAAGNVFLPTDEAARAHCKRTVEAICARVSPGDVSAETTNGDIVIENAQTTSLDVSTVNGDVTFNGTMRDGSREAPPYAALRSASQMGVWSRSSSTSCRVATRCPRTQFMELPPPASGFRLSSWEMPSRFLCNT